MADLPRPVAVVALFMPALLRRTLDVDRPHLDADLAWRPPVRSLRLAEVARRAIPYRSERDIDRGVATPAPPWPTPSPWPGRAGPRR
jgi:hypothetical protein